MATLAAPFFPDNHHCKFEDNGDVTFTMANYIGDSMKMMHMMRSHQMLTDVVIEVNKEKFYAHRVILASASPYFKAMFTGTLREAEMNEVKIHGICPTAMRQILDFMYTGIIKITEVTVCALLTGAAMFQVTDILTACCLFLEKQIDPSNVIGISMFAEQNGCKELYCKSMRYIEQHFEQVCCEEEFLQLTAMQLVKLVRRDTLNVIEERVVYNAVVRWVKYDEERRRATMQDVLHAVRCQHLPPSFLRDQVDNCELVKRSPKCRKYLAKIFRDLTLHKKPLEKARTPNTPRIIYLVGGYYRYSLDIMEAYNVDENTWIHLKRLSLPRSGLGGAFLKGMFYAVGGRNITPKNRNLEQQVNGRPSPGHSFDSDWVDRYNPGLDQWRPCSPMSIARNRVGVVVLDGLLYAVGGCSGSIYHKSAERYDPDTDRWAPVRPMHHVRLGAGVGVVNRLLYAVGGFDGKDRLDSVECYHPENNQWTMCAPMLHPRSGLGVATVDNYLYAVGGYDGKLPLNVVERYDTETGLWERICDLTTSRSALSVSVLDGKIYAMGGFDGVTFVNSVEVYDPVVDKWEPGVPLTKGRSGHAAAVSFHQCMVHCKYHEVGINISNEPPRTAFACCPADRPAPRYDERDPTVCLANSDLTGHGGPPALAPAPVSVYVSAPVSVSVPVPVHVPVPVPVPVPAPAQRMNGVADEPGLMAQAGRGLPNGDVSARGASNGPTFYARNGVENGPQNMLSGAGDAGCSKSLL